MFCYIVNYFYVYYVLFCLFLYFYYDKILTDSYFVSTERKYSYDKERKARTYLRYVKY